MKTKHLGLLMILAIIAPLLLSACQVSTSTAFCAYVVGDGTYDRDIDNIIFPGQEVPVNLEHQVVQKVPCNQRNYIVTNGTKTDVAGQLGDNPNPIRLTSPSGTKIIMEASAFWTLNQDPEAMKKLYTVFYKYDAFSSVNESSDGNVNASTPGWNKMLSENFGPTMNAIAKQAMTNLKNNPPLGEDGLPIVINDDIWKTQDTDQFRALADEMSRLFSTDVSKRLGFNVDLFCGSGNSMWVDPEDPSKQTSVGQGKFYCAPVRIEVNSVEKDPDQGDTGSQGVNDANQQRYLAAWELYHDQTDCWLGVQDAIRACKDSAVPCTFIIDGSTCKTDSGSTPETILLPNNFDVTQMPVPTEVPTETPAP